MGDDLTGPTSASSSNPTSGSSGNHDEDGAGKIECGPSAILGFSRKPRREGARNKHEAFEVLWANDCWWRGKISAAILYLNEVQFYDFVHWATSNSNEWFENIKLGSGLPIRIKSTPAGLFGDTINVFVVIEAAGAPDPVEETEIGDDPPVTEPAKMHDYDLSSGTYWQFDPTTARPGARACREMWETTDWTKSWARRPKEEWPVAVLAAIDMMFQSVTLDAVWAGTDAESLVAVYNEGYGTIVPHPESWGRSMGEVWAGNWEWFKPLTERCLTGETIYGDTALMPHTADNYESYSERYLNWSLRPIKERGKVVGIYGTAIDHTKEILAERRARSVRLLSEAILHARSRRELFEVVTDALEKSPEEAPFTICYSVEESKPAKRSEVGSDARAGTFVHLALEATCGVPEGHRSAPPTLTLELAKRHKPLSTTMERLLHETNPELLLERTGLSCPTSPSVFSGKHVGPGSVDESSKDYAAPISLAGGRTPWPILQALQTRQCVLVKDIAELIEGYEPRMWGHNPESAMLVPLVRDGSTELPSGVLIIGLNYRRPLDEAYSDWIQSVRVHITSGLGSVNAFEFEVERRLAQEKLDCARTAWFRGAAHEFRSPLTLIAGPLEDALRQPELQGPLRRYITLAQKNVTRLQRLVTSLLDFSKMEAGFSTARFATMDLAAFVMGIGDPFRPAIERVKMSFSLDIDDDVRLATAVFDPVLLEMAISNLLSNALKYTQAGSISMRLWLEGDLAHISVQDTGVGIPSGELDLVGNWFHRAQTAYGTGAEGTGVGLGLATEITKLHGGKLLLESKTVAESADGSHGSTFTIMIPIQQEDAEAGRQDISLAPVGAYGRQVAKELIEGMDGSSDRSSDSGLGSTGLVSSHSGEGLMFDQSDVLLVVDDNRDIREYIKLLFQPFCKVLEAPDGQAALDVARVEAPNLILSDGDMPRMNGQELLAAVRRDPKLAHIPVVLVSAATDDETRIGAIMDGAEDYLTKPFKPRELLARVHLHMQMGKKRRQLEQRYLEREQQLKVLNEEKLLEAERRRQEAEDSKRQQELLVDLTSHEIRTPVSAILQCSSLVRENLIALKEQLRYSAETSMGFHPTPELLCDLDEDVEALDSIYTCGQVQERIASDILSLARIQLDMLSLYAVETDIRRICYRKLRVFKSEARANHIDLVLQFGESLLSTGVSVIKTDRVRLSQVLTNLVTNAIKFTATADVRRIVVRLDVAWSKPESGCGIAGPETVPPALASRPISDDIPVFLYVSVTDSGPGMCEEEQANLFERFHQGNRMMHTRFGGTGLGLFICRKITRLLGGDIEVQSAVGKGSTFRFYIEARTASGAAPTSPTAHPSERQGESRLPLVGECSITGPIDAPRPRRVRPAIPRAGPFRRTPSPSPHRRGTGTIAALMKTEPGEPTFKPPGPAPSPGVPDPQDSDKPNAFRVLIVEDNLINQKVLQRQLTKAGHVCAVASNGQEALDILYETQRQLRRHLPGARRFDIVLMDLEMPVMDGLTALVNVRGAEGRGVFDARHLIFAVTGNARQGQIDQARELGMDDVVLKPYNLKNLLEKMCTAVAAHRAQFAAPEYSPRLP